MPTTPTFKVSYTLRAEETALGSMSIQGRLSYIEDNERKTFEVPEATVLVTGSAQPMVADVPSPAPALVAPVEGNLDNASANDLVSAAGGAPVMAPLTGALPVAVVDQAFGIPSIQGPGNVRGERTVTPLSANEMLVEVTIQKGDIRGFGKLQETIPTGFTALEHRSSEAIFTTQDRIVKFVWLNLPAKNDLTVSYKIRTTNTGDGQFSLDGEFGYLLNDETQKAVIGTSRFFIGSEALKILAQLEEGTGPIEQNDPGLALQPKPQPTPEPKKEPEPARPTPVPPPAKEQPRRDPPPTAPRTTIPSPERGITYKVQITAAHREVGRPYFQARHRYSGDFSIERHEGWIKYVTGRFSEYREARDHRVGLVQAGHQFPGPFVTAYNNGERITVQEALLISNQKWVQ